MSDGEDKKSVVWEKRGTHGSCGTRQAWVMGGAKICSMDMEYGKMEVDAMDKWGSRRKTFFSWGLFDGHPSSAHALILGIICHTE